MGERDGERERELLSYLEISFLHLPKKPREGKYVPCVASGKL